MIGSPLPLINVRPFTKSGMFQSGRGEGPAGVIWEVALPSLTGSATFDGVLELYLNGHSPWRLSIGYQPNGFGHRRYFISPCCFEYCEQLVEDEGQLLCLTCYKALSPHRFSKSHRRALILEAQHRFEHAFVRRRLVYRQPAPRASKRVVCHAELPLGDKIDPRVIRRHTNETSTAIARGRGLGQSEVYNDFIAIPYDEWALVPTADGYSRPMTVARLDDYPMLDVNQLAAGLTWTKDGVIATTLYWGEKPVGQEVALFIDYRASAPIIVVGFDWVDAESRRWQRLPIVRQPNGRIRFICPVIRKCYDALFLRDGLFASREAQRLVHASQRADGRTRSKPKPRPKLVVEE